MKAEQDAGFVSDNVVDLDSPSTDLQGLRMEFLSTVAHELRSPATVVAGIAHLLKWRDADLDEAHRDELLGTLDRESGRLLRLVQEFLDLDALERGDMKLDLTPVDLVDLSCEAMIDAGKAERTYVVACRADCTVAADRDRIKQVLINLLSNAARFSAAGDRITVEVSPSEDSVEVAVIDDGPGLSDSDRARLLDDAGRLAPVGEPKPGAGTGLYVSKLVAEMHGGHLRAEEHPERGARFVLSLPRRPSPLR